MKYKALKKTETKIKKLNLCGGINKSVPDAGIFDNQLKDSLNIISKNGIVKTRNGIFPKADTVVGNYDNTGASQRDLTVTETEFSKDGIRCKIGYAVWGSDTYQDIYIYLVSPDGSLLNIGGISLYPSDGSFFEFENIFFVVGKELYGSGIYVFLKRKNCDNNETDYSYEIYECNAALQSYRLLTESDFYTPTVYINGRGNGYEEARSTSTVFEDSPACPEEINILGGRFNAYFTTDSTSTSFIVPVSGISNSHDISCRLYSDASNYTEWIIPAGQNEGTAKLYGGDVKLMLNRSIGCFTFYISGTRYSINKPTTLNGNNLCFTCVKEIPNGIEKIIGSKNSASHNSCNYLYGNDKNIGEIYSSKFETPLYFPETMRTTVGNSTGKIKLLKSFKNGLYAFKDEGIFKISSAGEAGKLTYSSPVGLMRDFAKPSRLSNSAVNLDTGIESPETLSVCADKPVWLKGRRVYTLSASDKIREISAPVNTVLASLTDTEIKNAFSANLDGLYYLFFGNKVLVLNYENNLFGIETRYSAEKENNGNVSWFYLELPTQTEYVNAFCNKENMFIICRNPQRTVNYLSTFSGSKDIILSGEGPDLTETEKNINFALTTKSSDFETDLKKSILSLNLQMTGNSPVKIDISGDGYSSNQSVILKGNALSDIKVFPFFIPVNRFGFSLSGNAPFTLTAANAEYSVS